MADDYNNNEKQREINNFFKQFDKISDDFKKTTTVGEIPKETEMTPLQQRRKTRSERLAEQKSDSPLNALTAKLIAFVNTVSGFLKSKFTTYDHSEAGDSMATNGKRKKQKKYRINVKQLLKAFVCLILVVGVAGIVFVFLVIKDAPEIEPTEIYALLTENSILYDDKGEVIENVFNSPAGKRTNISYSDLPENLRDAFVAIEDKTFWKHNGFNVIRIFGAIKESIFSGGQVSGTSTITQQLARNLYLTERKSEYTLTRKVLEAYYTVLLEKHLTKEEILEAYLNTIFLGFNTSGVQAASQAYFSKDVTELTLLECAALAAIPKAPDSYALIKAPYNDDVAEDNDNILYRGETLTYLYNGDISKDRRNLTLKFMFDQGYITKSEYDAALSEDLRADVKPNTEMISSVSSYFIDYVIEQVVNDLVEELGMDYNEAKNRIYNGGLRIYTTIDSKMQNLVETQFASNANFPTVARLSKDNAGTILNTNGKPLLYDYNSYFDEAGTFTLHPDEYLNLPDGSLLLHKDRRLNFYKTEVQGEVDYSIEFKNMYTTIDGVFYSIGGGFLSIPKEYKEKDSDGNIIISAQFFTDKPDFFTASAAGLSVSNKSYALKQSVIQPQSAMVITDYKTGQVKTMVGGRNTVGKLLYNRAVNPRQPGSSIKPMGVYGPALQSAVDALNGGTTQIFETNNNSGNPVGNLYGRYWTAASVIDDAPLVVGGKQWPKNWYSGFKGLHTMRAAVQESVNVCAVKVFQQVGPAYSTEFLKKLGVTSIVESGDTNDMNAAALALGGMTKGVSPLEMASGYGAFPNQGTYVEPIVYTKITNKRGDLLLEKIPRQTEVMDKGVAWLMTDILRTTVTNGLGRSAAIGIQPVAGKTGTTTDNFDAWFVGVTPQYAAALWIGNDVNIQLSAGSVSAARLWSKVMKEVCAGLEAGSFPAAPSNIISVTVDTKSGMLPSNISALDSRGTVINEYFISGTEPIETDTVHTYVNICTDSGYFATPYCLNKSYAFGVQRPYTPDPSVGDIGYEVPHYYCNIHNPDVSIYPVAPNAGGAYTWNGMENTYNPEPQESTEGGIQDGNGNIDDAETQENNVVDSQSVPIEEQEKPSWIQ